MTAIQVCKYLFDITEFSELYETGNFLWLRYVSTASRIPSTTTSCPATASSLSPRALRSSAYAPAANDVPKPVCFRMIPELLRLSLVFLENLMAKTVRGPPQQQWRPQGFHREQTPLPPQQWRPQGFHRESPPFRPEPTPYRPPPPPSIRQDSYRKQVPMAYRRYTARDSFIPLHRCWQHAISKKPKRTHR